MHKKGVQRPVLPSHHRRWPTELLSRFLATTACSVHQLRISGQVISFVDPKTSGSRPGQPERIASEQPARSQREARGLKKLLGRQRQSTISGALGPEAAATARAESEPPTPPTTPDRSRRVRVCDRRRQSPRTITPSSLGAKPWDAHRGPRSASISSGIKHQIRNSYAPTLVSAIACCEEIGDHAV